MTDILKFIVKCFLGKFEKTDSCQLSPFSFPDQTQP